MHYIFNNVFRIALIYAYILPYFEHFLVQKVNFDHKAVIRYYSYLTFRILRFPLSKIKLLLLKRFDKEYEII